MLLATMLFRKLLRLLSRSGLNAGAASAAVTATRRTIVFALTIIRSQI